MLRSTMHWLRIAIQRHAIPIITFIITSFSDVVGSLNIFTHGSFIHVNFTARPSRAGTSNALNNFMGLLLVSMLGLWSHASGADHSFLGYRVLFYIILTARHILGNLHTTRSGIWLMSFQGRDVSLSFASNGPSIVSRDASVDRLGRWHLLDISIVHVRFLHN
jgi:hypothetical protein